MSLWFKSPMPAKSQLFFFCYTLTVMALFALVGILIGENLWGWAAGVLVLNILIVGMGFMIRKRVLRSMGIVKE